VSLPIRVLCRTDLDWGALARAHGAGADSGAASLPRPEDAYPKLFKMVDRLEQRDILQIWDRLFRVNLFAFRHELQRISLDNLRSVRDARLTIGFRDFEAWYEGDDDEMIYPIDDDDYFHPDLARTAPDEADETPFVFWLHMQYVYDKHTGSPMLQRAMLASLLSNNWGIRKSFLKKHFSTGVAKRVLADHSTAAVRLAEVFGLDRPPGPLGWSKIDLRDSPARFYPEAYGLGLKHVGSLLSLSAALRDGDVAPLTRPRLGERVGVPDDLRWAEPWIRRAEAAFRSLQL